MGIFTKLLRDTVSDVSYKFGLMVPVCFTYVIGMELSEIISKKLSTKFYDFSLRLNASEIGALKTGWPVVNVQPGKHTGYAFQWSALALALIVLAIFANSNLGQVIGSRRSKI